MLERQSHMGELESIHRTLRRGFVFPMIFALGVLAIVVLLIYVDAIVLSLIPVLVLVWVLIDFASKQRTELKIYEHGLTYQRLFRKHTCLWDEIEEFGHVLVDDYETLDLRDKKGQPIPRGARGRAPRNRVWLQKHDGEKFYFRGDMEDLKGIIDKISMKLYGEPFYAD